MTCFDVLDAETRKVGDELASSMTASLALVPYFFGGVAPLPPLGGFTGAALALGT
jgi:hypothetical protein